jgi:hypothetical protein
VAAQLGIIATGLPAAWHGQSMILTSRMVESPPSPCAPMPSALTLSKISMRSASISFCGPRALSWRHVDRLHQALLGQLATQCSAVPPMPMPSMPGGHQPAPICGSISTTQSTIVVAGVHHLELGLVLAAAALGRDIDRDLAARHHGHRQHAGRVVASCCGG